MQSYRLGDYAQALDTYNTLLSTSNPALEEYSDIQTNIAATETNLNFLQTGFQSSIHSLPAHSRGQKLEDMPLPSLTHAHVTAKDSDANPGANAASAEILPPKPKPARKSRVPKGVVPGVTPPPDPERWIKKSERTRVEGHGRKKKAGGGATQGSTAPEQAKSGGQNRGKKKK
jgi:signal recognition particle subunit SRP72